MEIVRVWTTEEQNARRRRKQKRILIAVGSVLILFLLLAAFYIWIYDGSKPTSFGAAINENRIKTVMEQFPADAADGQTELRIKQGRLKALLVMSAEQCDPKQRLEETYQNSNGVGMQYRKADTVPETEILLKNWQYTPLKAAFVGKGNPYAACYGKAAAKGKPNYRYMIEVIVQKGDSRYQMRAFCNRSNDLDSLLTAFAKQVAEMS